MEKSSFLVQTNWFSNLTECLSKRVYGVPRRMKREMWGPLTQIGEGDVIYIRVAEKDPWVFGPLFVTAIHEGFKYKSKHGYWFEVDETLTPSELLPSWIKSFPLCVFFDKFLANELLVMREAALKAHGIVLPRMGIIEKRQALKVIELFSAVGLVASEFLQRSGEPFTMKGLDMQEPRNPDEEKARQPFLGKKYQTKRGVLVRSKSELVIDDWLYDHRIAAEYEKCLPLGSKVVRPDFWLPDLGVCIEHLGLLGDDEYRKSWEWKRNLYDKHGFKYVILTESDISSLDLVLTQKLLPFGLGEGKARAR